MHIARPCGEIISGRSHITTTGARHFAHAVQRVAVEILAGPSHGDGWNIVIRLSAAEGDY